jgi:hypothetical protein
LEVRVEDHVKGYVLGVQRAHPLNHALRKETTAIEEPFVGRMAAAVWAKSVDVCLGARLSVYQGLEISMLFLEPVDAIQRRRKPNKYSEVT